MEYVHECTFCGWRRASATPVILSPTCEGCGCLLRSGPRGATAAPAGGAPHWHRSTPLRVVAAGLALACLAAVLFGAARIGYQAGGVPLAMSAVAAVAFAAVPLVRR